MEDTDDIEQALRQEALTQRLAALTVSSPQNDPATEVLFGRNENERLKPKSGALNRSRKQNKRVEKKASFEVEFEKIEKTVQDQIGKFQTVVTTITESFVTVRI